METDKKRITVIVDRKDAVKFKKIAADRDMNMSKLMRTFIAKTTKREVLVK